KASKTLIWSPIYVFAQPSVLGITSAIPIYRTTGELQGVMAIDQSTYETIHLAEYLQREPTQQVSCPAQSSWGFKGFHEFWLNETNAWIYPHLHKTAERMIELSCREAKDELEKKALNQAARELLLAQSSDWAFIMRTGTMVSYATRRTKSHLMRFNKLYQEHCQSNRYSVSHHKLDRFLCLGLVYYKDKDTYSLAVDAATTA
ncbi:1,4-alpha-glucan branching protein domain-containing protein, partial [Spirulina sp. 06S082]|uniref:1,4-alpha-glucan branching protein domain-containing protein n=1 Tax=Spirulina sp. 06S082 TaxID=3110248 RepID=UPI002B21C058